MDIWQPIAYRFSWFAAPTALAAAAILALGFFVLIRERHALGRWQFFATTLAIDIWLTAFSWMYCAITPSVALWWAKAAYLGVPFIPIALYHFTVTVLRKAQRCRVWIWLNWLVACGFSATILTTDWLIHDVRHFWWGYYPAYGWLSIPYLGVFFALMVVSLRHFWIEYRQAVPGTIHHRRIRGLLVAYAIAYLGSVDYLAKYGIPVYPFGYLPILGFLIVAARAIWRYRLVDVTPSFAAPQVMDTMADALLVIDHEGIVRLANAAACHLLGQSASELAGQSAAAIADTFVPAEQWDLWQRTGAMPVYEVTLPRPAGQSVTLNVTSSVIRDRSGQPVSLVCIAHDITERKRTERRLATQYAVAHVLASATTIADAAPPAVEAVCQGIGWELGAIWYPDEAGQELQRSDSWHHPSWIFPAFEAASRHLRFTRGGGLPGRVWATGEPVWLPDAIADDTFRRASAAAKDGLHGVLGFPIRSSEKVVGVLELVSRHVQEPQLDLLQLLEAIGSQIGLFIQRKDVEAALRESKEQYHTLARVAPVGIFRTDEAGHCLYVNRQWCEIAGMQHDGAVGEGWMHNLHPEERERISLEWQSAVAEHRPFSAEYRFLHADGVTTWVLGQAVPERAPDGRVVSYVGSITDITERKRAEGALQQAHAELKQSHDALQSAQLQLIQAAKLESVGRLAAGVAHEVKNPLAIICTGVEYLRKQLSPMNGRVHLILDDMLLAIKRADTIIKGLLDFSVLREVEMRPEPVNAALEQALQLVKHEMDKAHVAPVLALDETLPTLWMDRQKMEQVFVNIFLNAVYAMPAGGTLTIRTYMTQAAAAGEPRTGRRRTDARPKFPVLVVEVDDTGAGIPEEKLQKVFDPFFTTKPTGQGTGLGLTVAKRIVELHSGTIDLRNRPEGGVRATLMFHLQGGESHGAQADTDRRRRSELHPAGEAVPGADRAV